MPFYHVAFIYNSRNNGWTETYYRYATSGREACSFPDDDGEFAAWMSWRPPSVKLEAIRAQEVSGLRRVFLRELSALVGTSGERPDVIHTSVVCRSQFVGGSGRTYSFRGVPDELVKFSGKGEPITSGRLGEIIDRIARKMQRHDFRGQRMVDAMPTSVTEFSPHPETSQFTRAKITGLSDVTAAGYCYFNGPPVIGVVMRRKFFVIANDGQYITFVNPWPDGLVPQTTVATVRRHEYEWPQLEPLRLVRFGSHRTGTRYHPATWEPHSSLDIPINPCGRIVDYLRVAYRTQMRFFRDDPNLLVPVRWYFPTKTVLPAFGGAILNAAPEFSVPFEHPFASRKWQIEEELEGPLGEANTRVWNKGKQRTILSGWGLSGTQDEWENGAGSGSLYPAHNESTGQPCPCGPGVAVGIGGAGVGGALTPAMLPPVQVGRGGAGIGVAKHCTLDTVIEPVTGQVAPSKWEVTFSGIGNGISSNCDVYNRKFILHRQLNGWGSDHFDPVEEGLEPFRLFFWHNTTGVTFDLLEPAFFIPWYGKPIEEMDFSGPVTLPSAASPLACEGFPDEITLYPVTTCRPLEANKGNGGSGAGGCGLALVTKGEDDKSSAGLGESGSYRVVKVIDDTSGAEVGESGEYEVPEEPVETVDTFNSSDTWTCPSGVTSALVECWGGGGGDDNLSAGSPAGGGGAYARGNAVSVTPTTVYTVTVGAGGGTEQDGGDSWFSTTGTVLAKGGKQGAGFTGGGGGDSSSCIGDVVFSGGNGGGRNSVAGGGGGGAAGPGGNGANGTNGFSGTPGTGGAGNPPGGDGGDGGANLMDGQAGDLPGGGAGGRGRLATGHGGGGGRVVLTYFS